MRHPIKGDPGYQPIWVDKAGDFLSNVLGWILLVVVFMIGITFLLVGLINIWNKLWP